MTWTPASLPAGSYRVSIFNVTHSFATSNAQLDVVHSGQTETSVLDQRSTGQSGWVDLGEFTFDGSGNEYVQLTNTSTNSVIRSDAVRFVPSQTVVYQWDALLRRVGRSDGTTDTVYVLNGQRTVADYATGTPATNPASTYVYASYMDEPVARKDASGNVTYFHRNGQYSITALTDSAGNATVQYAYDAYGTPTFFDGSGAVQPSAPASNRFTYTGREWDDALELYHYRARMYDATSGRFVSRDPIGYSSGSWMLVEYVLSSPLDTIDPSGNKPVPGKSFPPKHWPDPGPKWKWDKSSGRYKKGGRYRHWHNDPHHRPHWDEENKDGSGHQNIYEDETECSAHEQDSPVINSPPASEPEAFWPEILVFPAIPTDFVPRRPPWWVSPGPTILPVIIRVAPMVIPVFPEVTDSEGRPLA